LPRGSIAATFGLTHWTQTAASRNRNEVYRLLKA
jgi:hypothetical protein